MIPVAPKDEPEFFDEHVRQRGRRAIARLLGQEVGGRGRKPKAIYKRAEDIPTHKLPAYWTETRKDDDRSALDDMMDAYGQLCAYLAMRLERATGSPTIDHYISKTRDWRLVYEWSNYRLSAACVNGAKGTSDVVDPFKVQHGWFELDVDTFLIRRGSLAPNSEHERIDATLRILNLRQCVAQRGDFIALYRENLIDLAYIQTYAPFIASELRRQGRLSHGDI